MLNIKNLTKTYGEKKAVDDLTLHIAPGEIYGFIGHNGAGKTTTLKSVVGILQFDEGEITIDGISIKDDPLACKKIIAYIPDNPDLYEYMTGIKYLNFIADIFGVGADERRERIHKYADMFGLTDDLAQPVSAYSHGMKQKLAIISAWIHEPKLIIMDVRRSRPRRLAPVKGHDARGVQIGRRNILLDPRSRGCRKALRQGCNNKERQAHPLGHHGGGQGRLQP